MEKLCIFGIFNKRLLEKEIFNYHLWLHSREKPHVYEICKKNFEKKSSGITNSDGIKMKIIVFMTYTISNFRIKLIKRSIFYLTQLKNLFFLLIFLR